MSVFVSSGQFFCCTGNILNIWIPFPGNAFHRIMLPTKHSTYFSPKHHRSVCGLLISEVWGLLTSEVLFCCGVFVFSFNYSITSAQSEGYLLWFKYLNNGNYQVSVLAFRHLMNLVFNASCRVIISVYILIRYDMMYIFFLSVFSCLSLMVYF